MHAPAAWQQRHCARRRQQRLQRAAARRRRQRRRAALPAAALPPLAPLLLLLRRRRGLRLRGVAKVREKIWQRGRRQVISKAVVAHAARAVHGQHPLQALAVGWWAALGLVGRGRARAEVHPAGMALGGHVPAHTDPAAHLHVGGCVGVGALQRGPHGTLGLPRRRALVRRLRRRRQPLCIPHARRVRCALCCARAAAAAAVHAARHAAGKAASQAAAGAGVGAARAGRAIGVRGCGRALVKVDVALPVVLSQQGLQHGGVQAHGGAVGPPAAAAAAAAVAGGARQPLAPPGRLAAQGEVEVPQARPVLVAQLRALLGGWARCGGEAGGRIGSVRIVLLTGPR